MPSPTPFHIECPCCRAALSVDPATGAVLSHKAPAGPKADMAQALKDLEAGKGRRADLFDRQLEAEKNKKDILKKKFEEAVRRAEEDPSAAPPPREIDL